MHFFSGTSGLVLPVKQALYPTEFQGKSRLAYYASLFNSIEINSSFYKTPKGSTVAKWYASVPEHFKFTFKLSKAITHAKSFVYDRKELETFMKVIGIIGDKKGCLLIQFPPSVKVEMFPALDYLLQYLSNYDWKIAVEFRNNSWYTEQTKHLLSAYKASMVIHDIPASAPPEADSDGFKYLRFHGPGGRYRGSYSDQLLSTTAQKIRKWLDARREVYVYFNNTMGDALKNLQMLNGMVNNT